MTPLTTLQTIFGGIAAAAGLELFLHPHDLIAGGVMGISALVSFHTEKDFGFLPLLFNLPLLLIYSILGHKPVLLKVLPGLLAFSGSALLLAPLPAISGEPVIAALAGGLCLGVGAGLAIKSGGLLDSLGLEKHDHVRPSAFLLSPRLISMKTLLLICHGAVLISLGLVMGWERTLYSALACLAAYEVSTLILCGVRRTVWIAASNPAEVQQIMKHRLNLDAVSAFKDNCYEEPYHHRFMYEIHILDIPRFKALLKQTDPNAEVKILDRFARQCKGERDTRN